MSRDSAQATELELTKLLRHFVADPRLAAEWQRARREFFGGDGRLPEVADAAIVAPAELRFAEWFLLERESDLRGEVPAQLPKYAEVGERLLDSQSGVFLVEMPTGTAVAALDLQDDTVLELVVPPGSLQGGDLLVGRLYGNGGARWTPSTACAVFRPGAEIGRAFQRDLKRLDLDRRLQQVELEHLLLRRPDHQAGPTSAPADVPVVETAVGAPAVPDPLGPAEPSVPLEHLEADLERMLVDADCDLSASGLSQQLLLAVRPGPVVGPVLDQLAFDTTVDLDRLRELLVQIWNAHHRDELDDQAPLAPKEAPGETLGERLVRTLDEGLAQHRDVGELFAQLERMAGIEPEPEDDQAADADAKAEAGSAPDDDDEPVRVDDEDADAAEATFGDPEAGDLQPLVEEHLWETGRSADPTSSLRLWAELQRNAPLPRTDLEQVTPSDLMRLLLHVYLGAAPAGRARAVRSTFEELRAFYDWAAATQELAFGAVLDQCRGSLLDQVDRLQAAGQALSTEDRGRGRPGILQIEDLDANGFGVGDDDGGHHWIAAVPQVTTNLQVGDLLLGSLGTPDARGQRRLCGLVVVLPRDARELIE